MNELYFNKNVHATENTPALPDRLTDSITKTTHPKIKLLAFTFEEGFKSRNEMCLSIFENTALIDKINLQFEYDCRDNVIHLKNRVYVFESNNELTFELDYPNEKELKVRVSFVPLINTRKFYTS